MDNYNGFYKVNNSGYSLTISTFFNPITKEEFSERTWDLDDDRLYGDDRIQTLRDLPLNEVVRKQWQHHHGHILPGDTVKVVKGRKVPIGTVARVDRIAPYYDRYRRWCCDYVYLENGQRTNVDNCVMV